MTTVRDLITSSLRLISVVGAGENMTAEDATDGLDALNQMLDSWYADGTVIYRYDYDTIPLVSGVNTYTMGPSGDINTTRPVIITQATMNLGQIVYPLNIWSANTYSALQFPSLQTIPTDMFVNNTMPTLELKLYPVPIGGLTLNIYSQKPLTQLTLNTNLDDLQPGFLRALRFNLAVELAPDYQREASKAVQDKAYDGLQAIKRNAAQYSQPTMIVDQALSPKWMNDGYWGYNIYGAY